MLRLVLVVEVEVVLRLVLVVELLVEVVEVELEVVELEVLVVVPQPQHSLQPSQPQWICAAASLASMRIVMHLTPSS